MPRVYGRGRGVYPTAAVLLVPLMNLSDSRGGIQVEDAVGLPRRSRLACASSARGALKNWDRHLTTCSFFQKSAGPFGGESHFSTAR
jgi:hypothetical protein